MLALKLLVYNHCHYPCVIVTGKNIDLSITHSFWPTLSNWSLVHLFIWSFTTVDRCYQTKWLTFYLSYFLIKVMSVDGQKASPCIFLPSIIVLPCELHLLAWGHFSVVVRDFIFFDILYNWRGDGYGTVVNRDRNMVLRRL